MTIFKWMVDFWRGESGTAGQPDSRGEQVPTPADNAGVTASEQEPHSPSREGAPDVELARLMEQYRAVRLVEAGLAQGTGESASTLDSAALYRQMQDFCLTSGQDLTAIQRFVFSVDAEITGFCAG